MSIHTLKLGQSDSQFPMNYRVSQRNCQWFFFLSRNSAYLLNIISKLLIKNENTIFLEKVNKQLKSADIFYQK